MRNLRLLAACLSILSGIAILWVASTTSLAGPAPTQLMTFRDHHDADLAFTIEASPLAAQAGSFTLRVPGHRAFVGLGAATLRVVSPTSTHAEYDGKADVIGLSTDGTASVERADVSLRADLDPLHHTAEMTLTSSTDRYHLVQPAVSKGDVTAVLSTFETALRADDWRTIYALTTTDITANFTADAFVAQVAAQRANVGVVTGVHRLSVSDVQTNPAGMSFLISTYVVSRGASSATYDVYFVRQGGDWKLWFSAPH